MKLAELLDKIENEDFLLTVNGWCNELPFYNYEEEKREDYWKKYRDRKVISIAVLTTNEQPELNITIE